MVTPWAPRCSGRAACSDHATSRREQPGIRGDSWTDSLWAGLRAAGDGGLAELDRTCLIPPGPAYRRDPRRRHGPPEIQARFVAHLGQVEGERLQSGQRLQVPHVRVAYPGQAQQEHFELREVSQVSQPGIRDLRVFEREPSESSQVLQMPDPGVGDGRIGRRRYRGFLASWSVTGINSAPGPQDTPKESPGTRHDTTACGRE